MSVIKNINNKQKYEYVFCDCNCSVGVLDNVDNIKDLGVTVDSDLIFNNHIYEKSNKAYQILGLINRNFSDLDKNSFVLLYKSLVRSHIKYAS